MEIPQTKVFPSKNTFPHSNATKKTNKPSPWRFIHLLASLSRRSRQVSPPFRSVFFPKCSPSFLSSFLSSFLGNNSDTVSLYTPL